MKLDFFGYSKTHRALFRPTAAFTMLELLVTISISSILLTIGVARYVEFNKAEQMRAAGQTLKNNLRDIQAKATAGVKPTCPAGQVLTQHQVETPSYNFPPGSTLYRAGAFCNGSPVGTWKNYTLPAGYIFHNMLSVDFLPVGQGATSNSKAYMQNIRIRTNENPLTAQTKWYTLCVSYSGEIKDCGFSVSESPPTCTC